MRAEYGRRGHARADKLARIREHVYIRFARLELRIEQACVHVHDVELRAAREGFRNASRKAPREATA